MIPNTISRMKRILLLIITLSLIIDAKIACSPRLIESVTYHRQSGQTIAFIKLTDESIWKWSPDFYSENMLRKWQQGDEILIQANCKPGLLLKNLHQPHYIPQVALTFDSYLVFPSIESIENKTISLSDGSVWELLFEFNRRTLRHWSIGDRIIPVRGEIENFQLIDIDIPFDNRAKIERYIEVLPKPGVCLPFTKSKL
jgi:hypothetical protein